MATAAKKQLERILTDRLGLKDPEFYLEKLSGGKLSGNVVSDTFVELDHVKRQRKIWEALEEEFGTQSHDVVGTLLAYTKAEWHVPLEGDPEDTGKKKRKSN